MHKALFLASLAVGCSDYQFGQSKDGTTSASGEVEDSWTVASGRPSDVLFVVDTSGSMTEEIQTLGSEIGGIVDRLEEGDSDWQLMSVAANDGCSRTGPLDSSMSDWADRFEQELAVGDESEIGLVLAARAVNSTHAGECNEGFLRDDSILHVVVLSDERDQSPGWLYDDYWADYVEAMRRETGDPERVMVSAIAGPTPDGCGSDGRSAEPANGYADAVVATGGAFYSICDDWGSEVAVLAERALGQAVFELSQPALPDTIGVGINSLPRAGGWTYNASDHTVVLDPEAAAGDSVVISYVPDLGD